MFEDMPDAELIDVMGEATRDESTAIAQRLVAVGELYARRAHELAETFWWRTDPTDDFVAVAHIVSSSPPPAASISSSRPSSRTSATKCALLRKRYLDRCCP